MFLQYVQQIAQDNSIYLDTVANSPDFFNQLKKEYRKQIGDELTASAELAQFEEFKTLSEVLDAPQPRFTNDGRVQELNVLPDELPTSANVLTLQDAGLQSGIFTQDQVDQSNSGGQSLPSDRDTMRSIIESTLKQSEKRAAENNVGLSEISPYIDIIKQGQLQQLQAEGGSGVPALSELADETLRVINSLPFTPNIPVTVLRSAGTVDAPLGVTMRAMDGGDGGILFSEDDSGLTDGTIVHELLHSAVSLAVKKDLTEAQRGQLTRFSSLHDEFRKAADAHFADGNMPDEMITAYDKEEEFLVRALSEENFQSMLGQMEYSPQQSFFERLKDTIKGVFTDEGVQVQDTWLDVAVDASRNNLSALAGDSFDVKSVADQVENIPLVADEDTEVLPEGLPGTDSAIGFSFDQAQKLLGSGVKTIGDLLDSDFIRDYGDDVIRQQEQDIADGGYQSRYSKSFSDTLDDDGVLSSLGWIWEKVQENLATGGLALAGSAAAAATAPLSAGLSAALAGTTLAGTSALGIGEVRQELEDQGIYDPDDALFTTGAGLVIGLLDRLGGKLVNKSAIVDGLARSGAIKSIGAKAVSEFGTEVAQEGTVIGSAALQGAEYEGSEVIDRLIDAGIIGGAMGLGGGAGSEVAQRVTNRINTDTVEDAAVVDEVVDTATVFGNAKGYVSETNAEKFGVPKAGDTATQIVERDGRFYVESSTEVAQDQVVDDGDVPPTLKRRDSSKDGNDAVNAAFDTLEQGEAANFAIDAIAQQRLEREQVGAKLGRGVDAIKAAGQKLGIVREDGVGSGPSPYWDRVRDYVQFDIGNSKIIPVYNLLRDSKGFREADSKEAAVFDGVYNRAVKQYIREEQGTEGFNEEQVVKDFQEISKNLSNGTIELDYKDQDKGYSVDNIKIDKDGRVLALQDGKPIALPATVVSGVVPLLQVKKRLQQLYIDDTLTKQEGIIEDRLMAAVEAVDSRIDQLADAVERAGGEDALNYQAFGKGEQKRKWVEGTTRVDPKVKKSKFGKNMFLIDRLYDYINGKHDLSTNEGRDAATEEMVFFTRSADQANNIAEFKELTSDTFKTSNGLLIPEVIAALGGYEDAGGARQMYDALNQERIIGQQLQRQQEHMARVRDNPNWLTRRFDAYDGDTDGWYRARSNPKTKAERKILKEYVEEVAVRLASVKPEDFTDLTQEQQDAFLERASQEVKRTTEQIRDHGGLNSTSVSHMDTGNAAFGSTLKRNEDLTDAHKAYLGEITDPQRVLELSIEKVSRIVHNAKVARELYGSQLGNTLFRTEEDALNAGVTNARKVKVPDDVYLSQMNDMWATPEMASTVDSFSFINQSDALLMNMMRALNSEFKFNHTIRNPATVSINTASGWLNALSQGMRWAVDPNFDVKPGTVLKDMLKLYSADGIHPDLMEALQAMGGGEAIFQEFIQAKKLHKGILEKVLSITHDMGGRKVGTKKLMDGLEGYTEFMAEAQKFGDLGPKVYSYLYNKKLATDVIGMDDARAKKWAAEYARLTMNDYSLAPKIVRDLSSHSPLGGGFLSFAALNYITPYHHARLLRDTYKMESIKYAVENNVVPDFDPNNKEHMDAATKAFRSSPDFSKSVTADKTAGLFVSLISPSLLTTGIATGMGALSGALDPGDEGMDEDDMGEMIRRLSPDYYENVGKSVIGMDEEGVSYLNNTRLANYGRWQEGLNALMSGASDEVSSTDAAKGFMGVMFSDFFSQNFGIKPWVEALANHTEYGQEVYNEEDAGLTKLTKSALHAGGQIFDNSALRQVKGAAAALLGDEYNEFSGQKFSTQDALLSFAGFKPIRLDPVKGLQNKVWELNRARNKASKEFSSSVFTFNKQSDSEITSRLKKRQEAEDEYHDTLISKIEAARYFGLSNEEITNSMNAAGVSKKKMKLLLRGQKPAFIFPKLSAANKVKKVSERGIKKEAKDNLEYNIARAKELTDN